MAGRRGRRSPAVTVVVVTFVVGVLAQLLGLAMGRVSSATTQTGFLDLIWRYPSLAALVLTVSVAACGALLVWLQGRTDDPPPPSAPPVPSWVVDRPKEIDGVVRGLCQGRGGATVGITTALHGAGGFGKTTLATMVCADERVRRHFGGRVYQVTIGRDVRDRAQIAGKVNETIRFITGEASDFTDPHTAGEHLGRLLDQRPRLLLVIDDVWEPEQLAPFLTGGRRCARVVTTRRPTTLPGTAEKVHVDSMSPEQSRAVLTWELPPVTPALVGALLGVTGRWPLLLRLVNRVLADEVTSGVSVDDGARQVLDRLLAEGPVGVDELSGAGPGLNLDDPRKRDQAVKATMEASTDLLPPGGAERLNELGIFVEDETIPVDLVTDLWAATSGMDPVAARGLCRRMADLSLVTFHDGVLTLHDVVRAYLRRELGDHLADVNAGLLDAIAATLPATDRLAPHTPGPCPTWWDLAGSDRYLSEHLITHTVEAGRPDDAEAIAGDLRWVVARWRQSGLGAPIRDLTAVGTPTATGRVRGLARSAHMVSVDDPEDVFVDVLASRLHDDPMWTVHIQALDTTLDRPHLVNLWPLPDLPDPAARQTLTGHTGWVLAVAVAPDGTWLATTSVDKTVRIWDAPAGEHRRTLTSHTREVNAVAVAPDGTWLATASADKTVRIWDATTGAHLHTLTSHTREVNAVAVAPDGTWLATASADKTVRIWDATTGAHLHTLTSHTGQVRAVAVAPDGTWLATTTGDKTVRIWDPTTGEHRRTLTGHTDWVLAVAVAPDGTWLATASADKTVRIWDPTTGEPGPLMRVDGHLHGCACLTNRTGLAVVGDAGVYVFELRQPGSHVTSRVALPDNASD